MKETNTSDRNAISPRSCSSQVSSLQSLHPTSAMRGPTAPPLATATSHETASCSLERALLFNLGHASGPQRPPAPRYHRQRSRRSPRSPPRSPPRTRSRSCSSPSGSSSLREITSSSDTTSSTHVVLPPPLAARQFVDPPPIRGPPGANLEVTPSYSLVSLSAFSRYASGVNSAHS